MDITIAILRLKVVPDKFKSVDVSNYEILLSDERSSSNVRFSANGGGSFVPEPTTSGVAASDVVVVGSKVVAHLPRTRITFDQEPSEVAANLATRTLTDFGGKHGPKCQRAVPVSLWKSEPSSPNHSCDQISAGFSAALFCAPVLPQAGIANMNSINGMNVRTSGALRYHPLDHVLHSCKSSNPGIDVETRHLLLRLDQWMKEMSKSVPDFLHRLFIRSTASSRILSCAHNPSHKDETRSCNRVSILRVKAQIHHEHHTTSSGALLPSDFSELDEDVRSANEALTRMIVLEKCDCFRMNPFFGSGLPYHVAHDLQQMSVQYSAKGRAEPTLTVKFSQSTNNSVGSESGSWTDDYPLHRAAYLGNAELIKQLLKQGFDVNQLDKDEWAPIHYAAWYGHLSALHALLNIGNCSVNVQNKTGSTPLHFAAWCGRNYVVELLLSHPDIATIAKDKNGKRPLDLCECVPKPEWQAVAKLLKAAEKQKLPKIQIDLMDGSNVMLSLVNEAETTVAQLHQQICAELKLSEQCGNLFAFWLCSESLQLQLNERHKPVQRMQQWKTKTLPQFADCAEINYDEPKLYFRRDARISVAQQKKTKLTDTALSLLFHEAQTSFLKGLYPCDSHETVFLAAILFQMLYGEYETERDKAFFSSDKSLSKLLPAQRVKDRGVEWSKQIMSQHKKISISKEAPKSVTGLQNLFLAHCQNLLVYGSVFFNAHLFVSKPAKWAGQSPMVHAAVNDYGLHLINADSKILYHSFPYKQLEWTFHPEKPYMEFRAKDAPIHWFTLRTRQAGQVQRLLSRWTESR